MSDKNFFINRYRELGWEYKNIELKQAIRINLANTEKGNIVSRLTSLGIKLEKVPFLQEGYWVCKTNFSVGATSEYLLGLYSIQEAAAQIPATLFKELVDKTVLDSCAAPGGKTVQLADLMHNTGVIIATDVEKRRLTALSNQLERCRVRNTIIYNMDARQISRLNMKFDRILLDVPCSGNFAADKDWFERRKLQDVEKNATLQKEILIAAADVLKTSGELVYSTCSLEPEENELNIDWAMKNLNLQTAEIDCYGERAPTNIFGKRLDDSVANCRRIWPGQTQGFFICKLRRQSRS